MAWSTSHQISEASYACTGLCSIPYKSMKGAVDTRTLLLFALLDPSLSSHALSALSPVRLGLARLRGIAGAPSTLVFGKADASRGVFRVSFGSLLKSCDSDF
jgi:hypothetical protein